MYSIPLQLENELRMMGILPTMEIDELEEQVDLRRVCMTKGYFNDPRDENGEVPY